MNTLGYRRIHWVFGAIAFVYAAFIGALLIADFSATSPEHIGNALRRPAIRSALQLSLTTSLLSSLLALWVAIPTGYFLARAHGRWPWFLGLMIDIPTLLPPLVVGLSLLLLFQTPAGRTVQAVIPITYEIPAIVLAQFVVVTSLATRSVRATFEQIDPRPENVAQTLGCSEFGAFWFVAWPQARRGVAAAGILAWTRAMGEFGPILVFAGATRNKTEVLSTSIYLELNVGEFQSALAISLVLVSVSVIVRLLLAILGRKP